MKDTALLFALRDHFSTDAWPWVLRALRQDAVVWSALEDPLFTQRALELLPGKGESWTTANLALVAIDETSIPLDLHRHPSHSFPDETKTRFSQAYTEWMDSLPAAEFTLAQAGLLALALRERWRLNGGWDGVAIELGGRGNLTKTILACLMYMIPDPAGLVHSLVIDGQPVLVEWLLHAILSNPAPFEEQYERVRTLFPSGPASLDLPILQYLAGQHPTLASRLAQGWYEAEPERHLQAANNLPDEVIQCQKRAEFLYLAGQPEQAIQYETEALRLVRRFQASVAASLAASLQAHPDLPPDKNRLSTLQAWRQAVQLAPGHAAYTAGLATALLDSGQTTEAQAVLHSAIQIKEGLPEPELLLAASRMAMVQANIEGAVLAARRTLEALEKNGSQKIESLVLPLVRALLELNMPEEAIRAAKLGLKIYPNQPELLAGLARAHFSLGQNRKASQSAASALATLASTGESQNDPNLQTLLETVLVKSLEAASDWKAALKVRQELLQKVENPNVADLRELASCALRANEPAAARQSLEAILAANPQDGLAIGLLGQAEFTAGNLEEARANLHTATRLAPHQPELWLSLAQVAVAAGDPPKAIEILRTAAMINPGTADIHLALGEACLSEGSPALALPALRRASTLAQTAVEDRLAKSYALAGYPPNELGSRIALTLGMTLRQLGHMEDALDVLEDAFKRLPVAHSDEEESLTSYEISLVYAYAQLLIEMGRSSQALPLLDIVIRLAPSAPAPYLDYARALVTSSPTSQVAQRGVERLQGLLHLLSSTKAASFETLPGFPRIDLNLAALEARALLAEAYAAANNHTAACVSFRQSLDGPLSRQPTWRARLSLGLGRSALALGQAETALAALNEAIQAGARDFSSYRSLSDAYLAAGLPADAFLAARTAVKLAPEDSSALLWFGDRAYQIYRMPGSPPEALPEAVAALEHACQASPGRSDLLVRMGRLYMQTGNRTAALQTFARLLPATAALSSASLTIEDASTLCEDLRTAARDLLELGDPNSAVTLLNKAVELAKGHQLREATNGSLPRRGAGSFIELLTDLALAEQQSNNLPSALSALEEASALAPRDPELHLKKAGLLFQLQEDEKGLAALQGAIEIDTGSASLHLQAARLLESAGQLPKALEHAGRAVEASTDVESEGTLHIQARCLAAELSKALLLFAGARQWIQFEPGSPPLMPNGAPAARVESHLARRHYAWLLAEAALEAGEEARAAQALATAQEFEPSHPRSLAAQARLFESRRAGSGAALITPVLGDWKEQVQSSVCRQHAPVEQEAATFLALAETAATLSRWEDALALAQAAVDASPQEPLTHFQLARFFVRRAEAQRLCEASAVVQHAPGAKALAEPAQNSFNASLEAARELLRNWGLDADPSLNAVEPTGEQVEPEGESPLPVTEPDDVPLLQIQRWEARGQAVFNLDRQSLLILEELRYSAEDRVALLALLYHLNENSQALYATVPLIQHPELSIWLALGLTQTHRRTALGVLRRALKQAETSALHARYTPILWALLARLANGAGEQENELAAQAIDNALTSWPDEARWHALAAEIIQTNSGSLSISAIRHLESAVRLEPQNAAHHRSLGQAYAAVGEDGLALAALEEAAQLAPEDTQNWLALARAQLANGHLEGAAASAEKAIEQANDLFEAQILAAEIALQAGNPQGSLSRLENLLQDQPEHSASLYLKARALAAADHPQDALETLEKAIHQAEDPIPYLLELAPILKKARDANAALEALRQLVQRYPQEPGFQAQLAELLGEAGEDEEALKIAQNTLQGARDRLPSAQSGRLHLLAGRLLRQSGQLDAALYHLDQAVERISEEVEPYLELGRVYQERRQPARAMEIYRKAMRVDPQDYRPYYQAGLAMKENKDYMNSESMLRRAAELAPQDITIHRMLGAVIALNLVHNRRQGAPTGTFDR